MTTEELNELYFDWIYNRVCDEEYLGDSYRELLRYLDSRPFVVRLARDSNRESDGVDLRYKFGRACGYDTRMINATLGSQLARCSVLEMMAALAIRIEETIMTNPDIGDRTGEWFAYMLDSLGLLDMSDGYFKEDYADEVIDTFLFREYRWDGRGGLFALENPPRDMRDVEIWYQAMWYLDTLA